MSMLYLNLQVKRDLDKVINEDPGCYLDDLARGGSISEGLHDPSETSRDGSSFGSRGSYHYTKDLPIFMK
jgi:hypothetical protein